MKSEFIVPEPISFHPFKHHRGFIISTLKEASSEELKPMVRVLNNNYIDIYTGNLSPFEVCREILQFLKSNRLETKEDFDNWLIREGGFGIAELSDNSLWILRAGNEANRFVHIHPSKTGLFTERIKGSTLKIFYLLAKQPNRIDLLPPIAELNAIRKEAGLCPVKKVEPGQGFEKAKKLFAQKI